MPPPAGCGRKSGLPKGRGELGHRDNDTIQGKRGTELKIGDAENVNEGRTENARQDEGQQKDGLTGNDEGG
ncbi:hypothetical protein [Haliea sp.]